MLKFETTRFSEKVVTCESDQVTKDKLFVAVVKYFQKVDQFSGAGICQSDRAQELMPELLSKIADKILKFKVEYKDED